ncbi:glycosyltransferase [Aureococcus anophagefferens]|nr:glycosyltransferase [Aureococcus anophagefferens]
MRWLLYVGVFVACLQFAYIAQLLTQHQAQEVVDDAVATSEAFARRPKRAIEYTAPARRREAFVTALVRRVHGAFASIRPAGFGLRNDPHRASDKVVWETFYGAVDAALAPGFEFHDLRRAADVPVRADGSIFVSISSFRDEVCPDTLDNLFATAARPDLAFVGLVQQNCDAGQHAAYGCKTAVMPEDMKVHEMGPDVDCLENYCARPTAYGPACGGGQVRVVKFNESETFGPVFGRYLGSLLWQGETYYMQKPELPRSGKHAWEGAVGPCMCDASFAEYNIVRLGAMQRYPIKETSPEGCTVGPRQPDCRKVPRFAPYIGAGFVFASAKFVQEVPFDPYLPFVFMGEELDFSARAWTSGWDIFCPPRSVVAHACLRPQKPKFWGALQRSIGAGTHNSLQQFVLPRVKHMACLDHFERRVEQHIVAAGATVGDFMAVARIENASDFDPKRFSLEALEMLKA